MSGSGPIVVEHRVACSPEHAFRVWTERLDLWWPREKSFAGPDRLARVVLEPGVGGRIHEVDVDGGSEDWGQVVVWDPPHRLAFTWHLMFPAADATDVEVTFTDDGEGRTLVTVTHGGWERLASDVAAERRRRNRAGWAAVLPWFADAATPPGRATSATPRGRS